MNLFYKCGKERTEDDIACDEATFFYIWLSPGQKYARLPANMRRDNKKETFSALSVVDHRSDQINPAVSFVTIENEK